MADAGRTDIMIVDKKIDLNIYKERQGDEPTASCCVPSVTAGTKTEGESCCVPSSSCCSVEQSTNKGYQTKEPLKKVVDLDFNELVSTFCRSRTLTLLVLIGFLDRLIRYICCQADDTH